MALFSYCIGNQLILGQSGSNDHKNVYHMLSVFKENNEHKTFCTCKISLAKRDAEFKLRVDCQGQHIVKTAYSFQGQKEMASS